MIPDLGPDGDGDGPDEYDAAVIAIMAADLQRGDSSIAYRSSWYEAQPHPATGDWLEYVWQNPTAWEILGDDVDREWFMTRLAEVIEHGKLEPW
jgi:hypothetical protein